MTLRYPDEAEPKLLQEDLPCLSASASSLSLPAVLPSMLQGSSTLFQSTMSTPTYLFQLANLSRTVVLGSTFIRRACRRISTTSFKVRHQTRCLSAESTNASSPDNTAEPKSYTPEPTSSPLGNQSSPGPVDPRPVPTQEAFLDAFESFIDDFEKEAEEKLSPAERRKASREQEQQAAREAYIRRLDILSSLPPELVVESVKSKCPGCGSKLQFESPDRPGYLPEPATEEKPVQTVWTLDEKDEAADPLPVRVAHEPRVPVCQRCYRLTHYGKIEQHLRVPVKKAANQEMSQRGSGDVKRVVTSKELSPSNFRRVLERLRSINAVIIYLVDIFDFHGTFINSVRDIVGHKNPIILAINKTDLLPENYKASRVERWIEHECSSMGLRDVAGVHLISSTRGTGVKALMADAMGIAKRRRSDIYVIGAANVGKSSFINELIRSRKRDSTNQKDTLPKARRGRQKDLGGAITTSVVPGTTLDVIRVPLGGNVSLFDTPGLMMPHQLTNYLDGKELKAVLPAKNVEHVTFRLGEGKALFIGGLARLEVLSGKPFFFTCFFAPTVKLHPGRLEDADDFVRRHVGQMLTPPYSEDRYTSLGEWTSKSFTAEGSGWKKANVDIVLSGLGWIAVTGPGAVRLRVCVPRGVGVFTREPLMPFEVQTGVSTYTGSSAVNRKQVNKAIRKKKYGRDYE